MSSNLEKLQLLSWKYLHLRKYHWIMSLMEICLPILLVYLIIKLGQQFIDFQLTREPVTIVPEYSQTRLLKTLQNYDIVYYTPLTNITEKIMHEFSSVVNSEKLKVMPIVTEFALTEKISQSKENIGIVFIEFSNLIKFKIRDRNEWHLDELFVENENQINGPYTKDLYYNTGYAAVLFVTQLASVRVKCQEFNLTPPSIPFNLHAFPYPEYTKSSPLRGLVPMLMGFVVVLTSLILCGSLLVNIIAEKESKVKELMKIAGIQEWLLWLSWFFNSLMISLVVYTTVTFLLQHDFYGPNTAAIYFVHPTILWTWIILYYISNISFCFFFCAAFNSTTVASVSFFMTTFVISYAAFKVHEWRNSTLIHICCLFPVGAFIGGFIRITYYEMLASPLTWRSLFLSEVNATDASLGFVFIAFIFDTFLYLFLTYFISSINPGRFEFKKFILYLLKGEENKIPPFEMKKTIGNVENQQKYFEEVLPNAEPSIELENLQKNFGNEYVVKGVNLIIYRSEILVLLGPNGAGKTTTLLMMTGLAEPTHGSVFYRDSDESSRRTKLIKKNLGYCPQEDRLFPYFSVMNHLLFFGMLKGATIQTAQQEAEQYLKLMELHSRSSDLSSTLSAGMRRNLCLAVALMGKSEILVLDEPTSGMDLESRRKVWNILLELRKNRTIILTTHHIEEADALGSRIAIMNHGIIKCCGSPIFLKKVYGTGYQLKIIRKEASSKKQKHVFPQILHLIIKNIPEARVEHQTFHELVVTLPLATTNKFPILFKSLEAKKKVLNIAHIEVSCTTMEQVFLKAGAGVDEYKIRKKSKRINKFLPKSRLSSDKHEQSTKGIWYIVSQYKTLIFKKKMLYMKRNSVIFFCHVVVPTLLLILLIKGTRKFEKFETPTELSLKLYPNALIMIMQNDYSNEKFYNAYIYYVTKEVGNNVLISYEKRVIQALLDFARKDLTAYRRDLLLANNFKRERNSTINLYYNRWALHSLPVAINTVMNVFLKSTLNDSFNIISLNHPVKKHMKSENYYDIDVDDNSPLTTIWFIMLGFFTVDLLSYFSMAVRVEHIDGFKNVQLVSGVSPSTYWISTLMFDSSIFLLVVLCRLFLFKHFDDYNFFASYSHIFLLIYLMFLFSFSGLLFIYIIINFVTGSKGGSYIIFLIFNIISTGITFSYYQFETAHLEGSYNSAVGKWILFLMKYIILLVPPFNFSLTLEKYVMAWRVNYLLGITHDSNLQLSPMNLQTGSEEKFEKYLEFSSRQNPNGMLQEIIFLGIDIILYAGLLYTIEQGHIGKLLLSVKIHTKQDQNENNKTEIDDEDVILERKEVAKLIENIKSHSSSSALIAENLKKIYVNVFKPPVTAVVNVTFRVQMGECFGLLGLNGAGKTTTFKMLTGEIIPTEGNSWLLNISLKENKIEYSSTCGYCAENYAVLEELTGRELLILVASLRGLSESDRDKAVEKWISKLGLETIQNNICSTYSGGEKRKISIALSLIGDPHVIFLDEPTRGADPISRRKLYDIINQSKYSGQAIVMSSHSVQESEILCDRITVLCQGAMKCINSPHHLKEKYAQGYTVSIKIRDLSELDMIHKLPEFKEAITSEFKPGTYVLKEESKGWLYYQIKDRTLLWSEIFSKMERLKTKQDILAEYIITETSLEEVFLAFARPT